MNSNFELFTKLPPPLYSSFGEGFGVVCERERERERERDTETERERERDGDGKRATGRGSGLRTVAADGRVGMVREDHMGRRDFRETG